MKKYIAILAASSALVSCSYTDPVEYNDAMVNKMDTLIGYHTGFNDALGRGGDTTNVAHNKYLSYSDKAIESINKMPEYSDGTEFKNSVVQIINNLKTAQVSTGKEMMEIFQKPVDALNEADYDRYDKLSREFDATWEKELDNFDKKQAEYAKSTGITIQEVGKVIK